MTCRDCHRRPVSPHLTSLCCRCAAHGAQANARGEHSGEDRPDGNELDWIRWSIETKSPNRSAF